MIVKIIVPLLLDGCNFVRNIQNRQQNNPSSNIYNLIWKSHLNLSWTNNNNFQGKNQRQGCGDQGFQGDMQPNQQFQAPKYNKPNPPPNFNFDSNINSNANFSNANYSLMLNHLN